MVEERNIKLDGLTLNCKLLRRNSDKAAVLIHGNLCSSDIWLDVIPSIPDEYDVIAPDLRGFGKSGRAPVDARKGLGDYSSDLWRLFDTMGYEKACLIGHSMGGGVALQMLLKKPERVSKVVLVDPISPFGFGGTKDENGTPCYSDYSGSGGGMIAILNPDFPKFLLEKYRGVDHPSAPANALRAFFSENYTPSEKLIDRMLEMFFQTEVGDDYYPGNYVKSRNWPYFAPGDRGVLNAFSPKYLDLSGIADLEIKPSIFWIHGRKDMVVCNSSPLDPAVLGASGIIPDYPGVDVFPPQPMLSQIRSVLERYRGKGGDYTAIFIDEAGHTPFIERRTEFEKLIRELL